MSNQETIFTRLLKSKLVFACLIFLSFLFLVSVFSYFIISDNSPNANTQHLEITLKEPGFKSKFLILSSQENGTESFLSILLFGQRNSTDQIPFKELKVEKEHLLITNHFNQNKIFLLNDIVKKDESLDNYIIEKTFLLGTDKFGRDIFSRLILGIRISLLIGFMSVLISLTIGIIIGASGAFFGGWVDRVVLYLINIMWSIPTLLLVFAIIIAFGRGFWIIFFAVGLTLWVDVARLVRGQVLKIKEEEFITAARSLSYSSSRTIFRHILPNIIGPLLVIAAINFAIAILIEAGLSYLGFGIQPPAPSIGNMLNENYGYAITGKPFLAFIPSLTIMFMVLTFNLIGSGLRDILDVKSIN